MIKKLTLKLIIPTVLLFIASSSFGQKVELTAFGGGTFAETINNYSTYYYKAKIGGSWHFGGALDYYVRDNTSISFTYYYQPTTGYIYGNTGYLNQSAPVNITYLFLGGNRYVGSDMVKGYGGIGLGMAILSPSGYSDATKFAFDIHLGVKINASDRIGIRLQAQLYAPVDGGGFGVGVGTGGAAVGVTTYSSILQFGGNFGLVFRLGQK
jgi:hypothetical protein